MLAFLFVIIGAGLVTDLVGGLAGAFDNAISRISSQAPASVAPSGVSVDTPVLDVPDSDGYTNLTPLAITGSVPGAAVGRSGYKVIVYRLGKDNARQAVAEVALGSTARFSTPPIALTEGSNAFIATLQTPGGEGGPSPAVTYVLDTTPPAIKITSPAANAQLSSGTADIVGTTEAGASVSIRNEQAPGGAAGNTTAGSDGKFKLTVPIVAGANTIDLTATDKAGNSSNGSLTINRNYGQLAAHLSVAPTTFSSARPTELTLTVHATSINGGPLAKARVTFTVTVQGLGPIVSPEMTTDATGTATWQVTVSGALTGSGQASVLITSPAGDEVTGSSTLTTT